MKMNKAYKILAIEPPQNSSPYSESLGPNHLGQKNSIVERLAALGLEVGTNFRVVGQAPFGGPYVLDLDTTKIALRLEELQCLKCKIL